MVALLGGDTFHVQIREGSSVIVTELGVLDEGGRVLHLECGNMFEVRLGGGEGGGGERESVSVCETGVGREGKWEREREEKNRGGMERVHVEQPPNPRPPSIHPYFPLPPPPTPPPLPFFPPPPCPPP